MVLFIFFIWSGWCFRTSEPADPGYMTICPPYSENPLPESAAYDVEIHKCGTAWSLLLENLGAADLCQMSAHLLRVSLLASPGSGWLLHSHSPVSQENAPSLLWFWGFPDCYLFSATTPPHLPTGSSGPGDSSGMMSKCLGSCVPAVTGHITLPPSPPSSPTPSSSSTFPFHLEGRIWTLSHRYACESESATGIYLFKLIRFPEAIWL